MICCYFIDIMAEGHFCFFIPSLTVHIQVVAPATGDQVDRRDQLGIGLLASEALSAPMRNCSSVVDFVHILGRTYSVAFNGLWRFHAERTSRYYVCVVDFVVQVLNGYIQLHFSLDTKVTPMRGNMAN